MDLVDVGAEGVAQRETETGPKQRDQQAVEQEDLGDSSGRGA